jgi:hypothetical protein
MQQRRLRPGDVLDDYCPRERRITDHAIVAMIEDDIKQTRCVSCDTEHEYKQAKVPPQRRKKAPSALFTQVLDGLQAPARIAQATADSGPPTSDEAGPPASNSDADLELDARDEPATGTFSADDAPNRNAPETSAVQSKPTETNPLPEPPADDERVTEEGPVRRPLIRAQLPRHEGQPPPTRDLPDFTIRQPTNGRGNRPGGHGTRPGAPAGRRRGGGHQQGSGPGGATRFGGGQARSNQFGRSNERRHGSRPGGPGHGHGQGPGQGQGQGGRPNRGGGRRGGGGKKP